MGLFLRRSAAPAEAVLLDGEGNPGVWNIRGIRRGGRFGHDEVGEGGLAGVNERVKGRAGLRAGVWRGVCR